MKEKLIFIAVIGGNDVPPPVEALAEEVGREIARQDAVLVCGGLAGVMEAACRGADVKEDSPSVYSPGKTARPPILM